MDSHDIDEFDRRPVGLTRLIFLGNPNLTYNAENWNARPTAQYRKYVEQMADRTEGPIFDGIVKNVRERYKSLDQLPWRYGIGISTAYYLRRCPIAQRCQMCPEFYFYEFDDRYMFIDLYRGLHDFNAQEEPVEIERVMERMAECKGMTALIKHMVNGFCIGTRPRPLYRIYRPFGKDWRRTFTGRSPAEVLIDICASTLVHGWRHMDVIKLAHLPSIQPWRQADEFFTLVAYGGERKALQVIDEEAPANFIPSESLRSLIELLRIIEQVKHSTDSTVVAGLLEQHPSLCCQISPPGIVPTTHYVSPEVTAVFAAHSPLRQLFVSYPCGMRKAYWITVRMFWRSDWKDKQAILKEGLSPAEVLMAWKRYERYEQRLRRKRPAAMTALMVAVNVNDDGNRAQSTAQGGSGHTKKPCLMEAALASYQTSPIVLDAFTKAYGNSFECIVPTGRKKFFVAVDVGLEFSNSSIPGSSFVKPLEAVACLLDIAIRKERSVVVAFSNSGLKPLNLTQSMSIDEIVGQMQTVNPGPVDLATLQRPVSFCSLHRARPSLRIGLRICVKTGSDMRQTRKFLPKWHCAS